MNHDALPWFNRSVSGPDAFSRYGESRRILAAPQRRRLKGAEKPELDGGERSGCWLSTGQDPSTPGRSDAYGPCSREEPDGKPTLFNRSGWKAPCRPSSKKAETGTENPWNAGNDEESNWETLAGGSNPASKAPRRRLWINTQPKLCTQRGACELFNPVLPASPILQVGIQRTV